MPRAERTALCDLFLAVGPDAPTLAGEWTTRDLAAHLVVRERRPDAAAGDRLPLPPRPQRAGPPRRVRAAMDGARRAGPVRSPGVEPDAHRGGGRRSPTPSSSSSTTRTSVEPRRAGRRGRSTRASRTPWPRRSSGRVGCSPGRRRSVWSWPPTVATSCASARARRRSRSGPDRRVRALRLRSQGRRRGDARRTGRRRDIRRRNTVRTLSRPERPAG